MSDTQDYRSMGEIKRKSFCQREAGPECLMLLWRNRTQGEGKESRQRVACQEHRVIAEEQAAPKEQKFSDAKDMRQHCRHEAITPRTSDMGKSLSVGRSVRPGQVFLWPCYLVFFFCRTSKNKQAQFLHFFFQKDASPVLKKQMQCTLLILKCFAVYIYWIKLSLFLINFWLV